MVKIEEQTVEWWKAIVESMNDGVLVIDCRDRKDY